MLGEWLPQPGRSSSCWVPKCPIPVNSQQSHEERTTINLLDPWGHGRSERLSHLPQFTQMTGRARIRIRLLAPKSGLLPLKNPPSGQNQAFSKVSDSVKPQLASGWGNEPRGPF